MLTPCRRHADPHQHTAEHVSMLSPLGDPTECTLCEVMDAATGTTAWGTVGVAMPPVCRATTRLARDAMKCWSPERHWLFHGRFREPVHTVLLVQEGCEGGSRTRARRLALMVTRSTRTSLLNSGRICAPCCCTGTGLPGHDHDRPTRVRSLRSDVDMSQVVEV